MDKNRYSQGQTGPRAPPPSQHKAQSTNKRKPQHDHNTRLAMDIPVISGFYDSIAQNSDFFYFQFNHVAGFEKALYFKAAAVPDSAGHQYFPRI